MAPPPATAVQHDVPANYKWVVLSNTTIGMLLATINSSILLIALPDIFRGIGIDPLAPANTNYLLWMILSFLTGRSFFPRLMGLPFSDALATAFTFSFIACLVAAAASWLRGGTYHHHEDTPERPTAVAAAERRRSPREEALRS